MTVAMIEFGKCLEANTESQLLYPVIVNYILLKGLCVCIR